jgi:hypothetical protein
VSQGPPGPLGVDLSSPPAVLGGPETRYTSTNLEYQKGHKICQEDTKTTTVLGGDKGYRDLQLCSCSYPRPHPRPRHLQDQQYHFIEASSLNHPCIETGRRLADSNEEPVCSCYVQGWTSPADLTVTLEGKDLQTATTPDCLHNDSRSQPELTFRSRSQSNTTPPPRGKGTRPLQLIVIASTQPPGFTVAKPRNPRLQPLGLFISV